MISYLVRKTSIIWTSCSLRLNLEEQELYVATLMIFKFSAVSF